MTAKQMLEKLRALGDPKRATAMQRFFKTGPGEYGEGDAFLGVAMPQIRAIARVCRGASPAEVERLLESPWHEARMLALLLLVDRYARADDDEREAIFRLYLRRTDRINNWDLVDVTAPGVLGRHLLARPRSVLRRLARSRSLWERRLAIISSHAFVRKGQLEDTLALAEQLLHDEHDLIHKAVGWSLREVGQRDLGALTGFLDRHAAAMPRTALRYAIEKLPAARRKHYMARGPSSL